MKLRNALINIGLAGILSACGNPSGQSVSVPETDSSVPVAPSPTTVEPEASATPSAVSHRLTGSGKVKAAHYTELYFRTQEQIAHVYVKNGARVSRGQKLADLDITTLNSTLRQAEISLAQAELELQDILIGQGYDLEKQGSVPADMMKLARIKSGYEQAALEKENALREIEAATLTAPFDGVIANLSAQAHHRASTGEPFCRLIQPHNMEVEFSVLESELHLIQTGHSVSIEPHATTLGTLQGEICGINPTVDEKGMIQVRARVKGNAGLMEGMNVTVIIEP